MKLPRYVSAFRDRHGKMRYRFRRTGEATLYLPDITSAEFDKAYAACCEQARKPIPGRRNLAAERMLVTPRVGTSYVYFVGGRNGPVKIGTSTNLVNRLYRLQVSSPRKVELLAYTEGGAALEESYHTRFAHLRISGEWFTRDSAISAEIKRLRTDALSNPLSNQAGCTPRGVDK